MRARSAAWPASTTSPSWRPRSSRCCCAACSTRGATTSSISIPTSASTAPLDEMLVSLARARHRADAAHDAALSRDDERRIDGFFILAAGVYNSGFIARRRRRAAVSRLVVAAHAARGALVDVARMMFTDQRWVDFVPCSSSLHPEGSRLQRRLLEPARQRPEYRRERLSRERRTPFVFFTSVASRSRRPGS